MKNKPMLELEIKERDSRIERLTNANSSLSKGLRQIVQEGAIGSMSVQTAMNTLMSAGYTLPKRTDDE